MTLRPRDVVVIGGGIAGLSAARDLRANGLDVELLEAGERVGGWIRSERDEAGRVVEWGPQSVVATRTDFHDLVREVGLDEEIELAKPGSKARYIYSRGRRRRLVPHPLSLLFGSTLGVRAKLRAATERFRASAGSEEETLAEFTTRRFGPEVTERLVAPFALGVHATTPDRLELRSSFPKLAEFEREHGSVLRGLVRRARSNSDSPRGPYTLVGGLASLPRRIAEELGDRIHRGVAVRSLEVDGAAVRVEFESGEFIASRRVIIATPPDVASGLVRRIDLALSQRLAEIEFAPVRLVQCRVDPRSLRTPRDLDGFGVLAAPSEGVPVLGAVFASSLFESRGTIEDGRLVVFVGGTVRPDLVEKDAAWEEATIAGLRQLFDVPDLKVEILESRAYPKAIPIPAPGHSRRIQSVTEHVSALPIELAGNYLEGVSLHAAIGSGRAAASRAVKAIEPESTPGTS